MLLRRVAGLRSNFPDPPSSGILRTRGVLADTTITGNMMRSILLFLQMLLSSNISKREDRKLDKPGSREARWPSEPLGSWAGRCGDSATLIGHYRVFIFLGIETWQVTNGLGTQVSRLFWRLEQSQRRIISQGLHRACCLYRWAPSPAMSGDLMRNASGMPVVFGEPSGVC